MPPSIPLLFLSGAIDELVPPAHFRQLYELSPATTKILKSLPQGAHNNTCLQENYWEYFYEFVMTLVDPVENDGMVPTASLTEDLMPSSTGTGTGGGQYTSGPYNAAAAGVEQKNEVKQVLDEEEEEELNEDDMEVLLQMAQADHEEKASAMKFY